MPKKIIFMIVLLLMATVANAQFTVNMKDAPQSECFYELSSKITFTGAKVKETGKKDSDSYRCYEAIVVPGQKISVSCTSKCYNRGTQKNDKFTIDFHLAFYYEENERRNYVKGGGERKLESKPLKGSCTVPKGATHGEMTINCGGGMGRVSNICHVTYKIVEPGTPEFEEAVKSGAVTPTTVGNWGHKCDVCGRAKSHYSYSGVANVEKCCQGEFKAKSTAKENHGYRPYDINEPVYEFDRFRVGDEGDITLKNNEEPGSSVKLCSNTVAVYMGVKNNQDRWYMVSGHLLGQSLKDSKQKKMVQMSNGSVVTKSSVHTFMAEEVNQGSRVWNLSGTMAIKNKKTKKTYTLKAGQVATITANGKMTVNSFDVNAYAKKYKINLK